MSLSGRKVILVPFLLVVFSMLQSSITEPRLHIIFLTSPSLIASAINFSDNALTAFIPTPLRPTDFLNTFESYLAPVFIFVTQSKSLPNGIPLP